MTYKGIISSLTILFIGFLLLNVLNSWKLKEKVRPQKTIPASSPAPEKIKLKLKQTEDDSLVHLPSDSIQSIPADSIQIDSIQIKAIDSIRSSQQLEQKPDIRFYRRIRQYNFHKRLPVS